MSIRRAFSETKVVIPGRELASRNDQQEQQKGLPSFATAGLHRRAKKFRDRYATQPLPKDGIGNGV
jgi:hypothetical protein